MKKLTNLKKVNNTNNKKIRKLEEKLKKKEEYFDNYEKDRTET